MVADSQVGLFREDEMPLVTVETYAQVELGERGVSLYLDPVDGPEGVGHVQVSG